MGKKTPELFSKTENSENEPLASRMRPRNLEEFIGQDHILGPGRLLRRAIQADQLSSLILYGPPGTGKTTLAKVIANSTKSFFISINAVLSGVKEIREAITEAKDRRNLYDRRTILFVDEVHRWNKAQQDALLPWVENGLFVLIGATTENPFFEVNKALASRSRIFQLKGLTEEDLRSIAKQCLSDSQRGYGKYRVLIDEDAMDHLVSSAAGDARTLLNALELAVETTPEVFPPSTEAESEEIRIDLAVAEESIQKKALLYDKDGDFHFDIISAFIKSIRGSDVDAALFWMARMVHSGEDPRYIFRRMLVSAAEDIGMADPRAISIVESNAAAFDRVGLPEGQFFLTNACIYLATAKKSNSALAYFDALSKVQEAGIMEVPLHLRDGNRDQEGFGHGANYKYPHAYTDHWVAQQYLPKELSGHSFYQPSNQGYEAEIAEAVLHHRAMQMDLIEQEAEEIVSFGPRKKTEAVWQRRTESIDQSQYQDILNAIDKKIQLIRHHRVLIIGKPFFSFAAHAISSCPEGFVQVHWNSSESIGKLLANYESLDALQRPHCSWGTWKNLWQNLENPSSSQSSQGVSLGTKDEKKAQNAIPEKHKPNTSEKSQVPVQFDCIILFDPQTMGQIEEGNSPQSLKLPEIREGLEPFLASKGQFLLIQSQARYSSSLAEEIQKKVAGDSSGTFRNHQLKTLYDAEKKIQEQRSPSSPKDDSQGTGELIYHRSGRTLNTLNIIKWFGKSSASLDRSPFVVELLEYLSEEELLSIRDYLFELPLPLDLDWVKVFSLDVL